jgi:hypothetical protein
MSLYVTIITDKNNINILFHFSVLTMLNLSHWKDFLQSDSLKKERRTTKKSRQNGGRRTPNKNQTKNQHQLKNLVVFHNVIATMLHNCSSCCQFTIDNFTSHEKIQ